MLFPRSLVPFNVNIVFMGCGSGASSALNPEWIKRGKFSWLYFRSLMTEERPGERAWKLAHGMAASKQTPVVQDMLLGLNAQINCDYGGTLSALGQVAGSLDEVLGSAGLKYYCERVWWNAISFLAASGPEEVQLVHGRPDWESAQLAESIACEGTFLRCSLRSLLNLFSKKSFDPITLESEETAPPKKTPEQVVSPF